MFGLHFLFNKLTQSHLSSVIHLLHWSGTFPVSHTSFFMMCNLPIRRDVNLSQTNFTHRWLSLLILWVNNELKCTRLFTILASPMLLRPAITLREIPRKTRELMQNTRSTAQTIYVWALCLISFESKMKQSYYSMCSDERNRQKNFFDFIIVYTVGQLNLAITSRADPDPTTSLTPWLNLFHRWTP